MTVSVRSSPIVSAIFSNVGASSSKSSSIPVSLMMYSGTLRPGCIGFPTVRHGAAAESGNCDFDDALPARLQPGRFNVERDKFMERSGSGSGQSIGQEPGAITAELEPVVMAKHLAQQRAPQRRRSRRTEDMGDEKVLGRLASLCGDECFRALRKALGTHFRGRWQSGVGLVWFVVKFVHRSDPNRCTRQ